MRKIEKLIVTATVVLGTVVITQAQDETFPESPWKPEKRQQRLRRARMQLRLALLEQEPRGLESLCRVLWEKHIKNTETGQFNRHSTDNGVGMEFPQPGSCLMDIWAREYAGSGDPAMKEHVQTLLNLYRSMRHPDTGAMSWCTQESEVRREKSIVQMNLYMATALQGAASHVEERDPNLAEDLRKFVRYIAFSVPLLSGGFSPIHSTALACQRRAASWWPARSVARARYEHRTASTLERTLRLLLIE
ncbi:MAG: hypothetical protein HQ581_02765 [Planctomycetes bacterium]|nr:hypothetical protein [Planctomycetota bacterium]